MRKYVFLAGVWAGLPMLTWGQAPAPAATTAVAAQAEPELVAGSPEWVVHAFFRRKDFTERAQYLTGDAARRLSRQPNPSETFGGPEYAYEARVFHRSPTLTGVAVDLHNTQAGTHNTFYVFTEWKQERWKLSALRFFSMPPLAMQMMSAFSRNADRLTEEDKREMRVLSTFLLRDPQIKAFFTKNRTELDGIADSILKARVAEVVHGGRHSSSVDKALWQRVSDLGFNYVALRPGGWIDFYLAGMGETALGLMYVPPRATPPPVTVDRYILIEAIEGPWFLYRKI